MNRLLKNITLVAVVAGLTATAHATLITGGISLSGGYATNTGDVNTATAFTSFTGVAITSAAGNYSGAATFVPGEITMVGFSFAPFPGAGVPGLWTANASSLLSGASFDFITLSLVDHSVTNALTIDGFGWLHLAGFDPTWGTYILTANQGGGTFSFSSSNAAVPDSGTTLLLLGAGITGLALIGRRQKRKS